MKLDSQLQTLIVELFEIGCIKFGEFTLKSGIVSPIYFDLRLLISFPSLMVKTAKIFHEKIQSEAIQHDLACGVPYGAISLATAVSIQEDKPLIFKRKEAKAHGVGNLIEGVYRAGNKCLVIDDVITSGISIVETVNDLRKNGLVVTDAIVILDREQGGLENLKSKGIKLHSVIKSSELLDVLAGKISKEVHAKASAFIEANRHVSLEKALPTAEPKELDYKARGQLCQNKIGKRLFDIMAEKQTNLCLSADYTKMDKILEIADKVGPHICLLKTHIDIVEDFDFEKIQKLVELSVQHNFLIFEDRKFADIGNTVRMQYSKGIYKINKWANIVNAHPLSGPGCVKGLQEANDEVGISGGRACLLIAQLSSKGSLINEKYTKETVKMAEEAKDFVIGFICQEKVSDDPSFIHMMPGVQLRAKGDSLGQQYTTPELAICEKKCDVIIVGRGITESDDVVQAAISYKSQAYDAYCKRISIVD